MKKKFFLILLLMASPAPDTCTVAELKDAMYKAKWWIDLRRRYPQAFLRVRWGTNLEDVPSIMTLAEMRRRNALGLISIIIDDGSGKEIV